nr:ribonuclease H-like domain-containing protein [Tanacetum cinerariifolium]
AVNTACYVLNRVLVTKPQNKTPYELLTGPKEANNSAGTQGNDDQDKTEKNTDFKTCEKPVCQVEQIFLEELEKLKRQEKEANDAAESPRKEATHDIQNANTNSTNHINTTSIPLSTIGPSRAFTDGELSYHNDTLMPHLKDIYASPSEGIFTDSSYDDEGVVTDFNNLETTVNVSLTPTIR